MSIGDRVRQLREKKKLSQSELARRSNLTPSAIWQYEHGDRTPSSEALAGLVKALGVSAGYLLGTNEPELKDLLMDEELQVMFRGLPKLSEADKQRLVEYFLFLKNRSKSKS